MPAWDEYSDITKSLLDRFVTGHSISIFGGEYNTKPIGSGNKKRESIVWSIPNAEKTKVIRDSWTDNRRSMPVEGIVFPDGSLLTILFVARGLPFDKILTPIINHIAITDPHSASMIGYVEKYSYCFYPNSELAEQIGYFRYDFHVDKMGDGDLGEHRYFHFHRELEESFRHATGPILDCGDIVSGLEKVLAGPERQKRLEKTFREGDFEALQMDLTIEGIQQLYEKLFQSKSSRKGFEHKIKYESFIDEFLSDT